MIVLENKLKCQAEQEILSSIDEAFGLWKDREFDTEAYIREIRKGARVDSSGY